MTGEGKQISVGIVSLGAVALTEPDSGFPVGGSELQLFLLARKLAATEGFSPTLYVADLRQAEREEAGLHIRPLVRMGRDLRLTFTKALAVVRRLARARHQVYVTRSASGVNGLVFLASRLASAKHLHMCAHDSECAGSPDATLSRTAAWLHDLAMRRADIITCQTESQLAALRTHYNRQGVVLPNLSPSAPPPASMASREGLLWVGRDVDWKQPELFVELARRLPEHPFTMVCQPQPGRDTRRLTADAPPNLRFIPGLPFDETSRLFAAHKILVCTSRREGFPNTFLQAAAAGTPIASLGVDPDGMIQEHAAGFACDGSFETLCRRSSDLVACDAVWRTRSGAALRWAQKRRPLTYRVIELLRTLAAPVGD